MKSEEKGDDENSVRGKPGGSNKNETLFYPVGMTATVSIIVLYT